MSDNLYDKSHTWGTTLLSFLNVFSVHVAMYLDPDELIIYFSHDFNLGLGL